MADFDLAVPVSEAELQNTLVSLLDGVTKGTVSASRAVIADANKRVDGLVVLPDQETASTASNITNDGVTLLASTAGVNPTYNLAAPVRGVEKMLVKTSGSTATVVSSTGSGASINSTSTGTSTKLTFVGQGQSITLVGRSTSMWDVKANVGSVAYSS
jgi:hypothetical protein